MRRETQCSSGHLSYSWVGSRARAGISIGPPKVELGERQSTKLDVAVHPLQRKPTRRVRGCCAPPRSPSFQAWSRTCSMTCGGGWGAEATERLARRPMRMRSHGPMSMSLLLEPINSWWHCDSGRARGSVLSLRRGHQNGGVIATWGSPRRPDHRDGYVVEVAISCRSLGPPTPAAILHDASYQP